MNASPSSRSHPASEPPYDRSAWAASVAFAALPLVLFLLTLWVFSGTAPRVTDALAVLDPMPEGLAAYAAARVGIEVLNYATYVFAHVILCLGASAYFLTAMRNRALAGGYRIGFEGGFALGFAAAVSVGVVVLTANRSLPGVAPLFLFSGLYVEPLRLFFQELGLDGHFDRYPAGTLAFLYMSVLVPTLFGIATVVAASAAFHLVVFCREERNAPGWQASFVRCVTTLKRQLTVLSAVLVSAVLTSRAYVNLMPSLVDPENTAVHGVFAELAAALSFASGILFTATLLAAFTPGAVLLLRDIYGTAAETAGGSLQSMMEDLDIEKPVAQIMALVRVVLTLVAPALAGPFMNVVSTAVG